MKNHNILKIIEWQKQKQISQQQQWYKRINLKKTTKNNTINKYHEHERNKLLLDYNITLIKIEG